MTPRNFSAVHTMRQFLLTHQPGVFSGLIRVVSGALALMLVGPVSAQPQRDPTQPPPSVVQPESAAMATPSLDTRSLAVVVRGGVSHLVVGTRLYAVGQQVGAAKIERISETEVWLRESGTLTKHSLFAGIDRHPTTTPPKQHKAAGVAKPAQPKP